MAANLHLQSDTPVRILLLEDSDIDAELVASHLYKAGLTCNLHRAVDRETFVSALESHQFDVILADFSLPNFDGLAALSMVRAHYPELPFIFVSGVVGEEFAINALQRGATDYVMKRGLNRLPAALERAISEARERSERMRAEEALRLSELSNQLAVELAGLGKWTFDPQSSQLELDTRCKRILGFAEDAEVSFDAFLKCCDPNDRLRLRDAVLIAARSENAVPLSIEYGIRRVNDAQERWLSTSARCFVEEGECLRLIGVVADITERKRVESSLQEMNQTLTQHVAQRTAERDELWQLSQDLFAVIDPDGRLLEVNPAWTHVLGYAVDELLGARYQLYVHPDDLDRARLASRAATRTSGRPLEFRLRAKNGRYRCIAWSVSLGERGVYVVGRDVSEDREAAARLAETEEALRQAQKMEAVGQLTGGVAHDFNNLLQIVVGNLETLQRKMPQTDARLKRATDNAMEGARRAANLTQRLLAFSRRQPLNPRAVELNRLVRGMSELLGRTLGELVDIETQLEPDLWRVAIDENQLESALLNLAVNARDAMPQGGRLRIETRNLALTDPSISGIAAGEYAALIVTDSGSGMESHVLARAFEPFFTTKAVGQGTGLGLSQVYGFVKQSGGHVQIESTPGVGTAIKILLPRLLAELDAQPDVPIEPQRSRRSGETILVVEDDDSVRAYTVDLLQELGYRVHQARDGHSALKVLNDSSIGHIDLLFSDVVLPGGLNGQQLANAALKLRPDLKVLFATGYARDVIVHDGRLDPGVQLIGKPFGYEDLALKLRHVLELPVGAM